MESEIIQNQFLGDYGDAQKWAENRLGIIICVLTERPPLLLPGTIWRPILDVDSADDSQNRASLEKLELASEAIEEGLKNGRRVLVHCGMGVDRSPLALAWFLHSKRGMEIDEAYQLIKSKRPIVVSHVDWIPLRPSERNGRG